MVLQSWPVVCKDYENANLMSSTCTLQDSQRRFLLWTGPRALSCAIRVQPALPCKYDSQLF